MISNMGFNEGYITLYVAEGTEKDAVVTVVDNNTCGNCSADQKFCGILKGVRNNDNFPEGTEGFAHRVLLNRAHPDG